MRILRLIVKSLEGWGVAEADADRPEKPLGDGFRMAQARFGRGLRKANRPSGGKNLFPGKAFGLPDEFGKTGGIETTEAEQNPIGGSEKEVRPPACFEGAFEFDPSR